MFERRKYERFKIAMDGLCPRIGSEQNVKINDFSKEGLGITSEEPIPKGVDVELELLIPGDTCPVIAKGEVIWVKEEESGKNRYKIGVKLRNQDEGGLFNCIYRKWMKLKKWDTNLLEHQSLSTIYLMNPLEKYGPTTM